ncbi:conserved hypothetical protein [Hyella patelloides LEGE 07179]|uniref:Phosphodiester glycosidase domain-containing protein n=1 Tax=Hyella patelloides LEGE 07179 TaxID=945734 RepID=A0A563VL87_9CYAN|nr:phosphodiester glycosidase family protein [Hyella patelloides]VEP12199.1 conserved hypothetical protein [Hyella patelloides LEGE 07179]
MVRQVFLKLQKIKLLRHAVSLSLGLMLIFGSHYVSSAALDINYQVYQQPDSEIHVVTIPVHSNHTITPEVAAELTSLEQFASKNNVIAAINGGYFDPQNQKTTSYIIQDTNLVADPRINERLIDNPDLKPYLGKILNRAEFRRYQCGAETRYDITLHSAVVPANCILQDALGAGPQLLPIDTSIAEGFTAYENGKLIRNAIGVDSPNARSAVAITSKGNIILAMVGQKNPNKSGMSLPGLTAFLKDLGAMKAMNLDGGSSSSLYYQGKTYYGRLDREGNKVQRPLKSVLVVQ